MTFDTNRQINSLTEVLDELEKTIRYALQNPGFVEGLGPDEPPPIPAAPVTDGTDVQFFLGEVKNFAHMSRPYLVWTLGDTRQAGGQHRGTPLPNLQNPRPFKKALDLIQCTMYGASIGQPCQGNDEPWKRGTVRGCEILRWCYWWALREHWGGNVTFERENWIEVSGNNQTGYAWASSFRVPMSQMRPAIPQHENQTVVPTMQRQP